MTIDWHVTDIDEDLRMELSNGVLVHYRHPGDGTADLTLTLTKVQLLGLLGSGGTAGIAMTGDAGVLETLIGLLDRPDPSFPIVTP